jgi:hypothetical protein
MRLKSLIEKIETDLPTGEKQLRSMNTGQLLCVVTKLLRMAGLSEEDIATFTAMDPKKSIELLKSVMRNK